MVSVRCLNCNTEFMPDKSVEYWINKRKNPCFKCPKCSNWVEKSDKEIYG